MYRLSRPLCLVVIQKEIPAFSPHLHIALKKAVISKQESFSTTLSRSCTVFTLVTAHQITTIAFFRLMSVFFIPFMNSNTIWSTIYHIFFLALKRFRNIFGSTYFFDRLLEQNLIKNVSNLGTFLWPRQIQTIKYGLNDTKRIKKKQFWPSTPITMYVWTILI